MAWEDVAKGAGTGAGVGSAFGPWGTLIGGAGGALLGGFLGGSSKETKIQKTQRELVDQLLQSLKGNGPYSDLFTANDADFEKRFAEPARNRFNNQTAPQIQQQYIQSGQHRGTGLEDSLARAGVNMDDMLNQAYMDYQQNAQNRQAGAIGSILGQGPGVATPDSAGQRALQGLGGYLASPESGKSIQDILQSFTQKTPSWANNLQDTYEEPRKGFENDQYYNPYTGIMGGQ